MAALFARGVAITRYTPQGSIQPFGQDTGTADDNTVVVVGDVESNYADSTGTAVSNKSL
jgi:hypothetical protein